MKVSFSDSSRKGKLSHICDYFFENPLSRASDAARYFEISSQGVRGCLKEVYLLACERANTGYSTLPSEDKVEWLKTYFVSHEGLREEDLVKETGLPYVFLKKDLDVAGVYLMRKRWYTEDEVLQRYRQGVPSKQIAYELGVSWSYVRLILNKYGLSALERRKEAVSDSFKKGNHSPKEISKDLGICEETARKWMENLHL
ncbi:MAG: helix-turn-helix domain-containing protein [Candidatus Pacearchaeota archaeon]